MLRAVAVVSVSMASRERSSSASMASSIAVWPVRIWVSRITSDMVIARSVTSRPRSCAAFQANTASSTSGTTLIAMKIAISLARRLIPRIARGVSIERARGAGGAQPGWRARRRIEIIAWT